MISGTISGAILHHLVLVPGLDLTIVIQVLCSRCNHGCFDRLCVSIWEREISSIQLTVRTCAHWTLIDITQQSRRHRRAIHDKNMKKTATATDYVISKTKVNISGAELINVSYDVIHGAMVKHQTPVS